MHSAEPTNSKGKQQRDSQSAFHFHKGINRAWHKRTDISATNYAKSLSKGMHACQHKAMTSHNTSSLKNWPLKKIFRGHFGPQVKFSGWNTAYFLGNTHIGWSLILLFTSCTCSIEGGGGVVPCFKWQPWLGSSVMAIVRVEH